MENLIDMYAALEKYPVTVSYPAGQIAPTADTIKLHDFKYDNDFSTIYTFGPYKMEHCEVARHNEFSRGHSKELYFMKSGTAMCMRILVNKYITEQNKKYVTLAHDIISKANGKKFKNPFEKQISDSMFNLMYYLRNVPLAMMPTDEVDAIMNQLEEIKRKLLQTQNINYTK